MQSLGKGIVSWSWEQYRSNASKEYNDFHKAYWRELIQNASDSGATRIDINMSKLDDNTIVKVSDNGCGMSLDIIQNKLLVIGGSQKTVGAVGGLGKAKELIYFSQPCWSILTNSHFITGSGGEYEIFENSETCKGTSIEMTHYPHVLHNVFDQLNRALMYVVGCCRTKAKIYVNDQLQLPKNKIGICIREIPELGNLYYLKEDTNSQYLSVMVNGCWMFNKWIGDREGILTLVIDSTVLSPLEGLSANRDSLRSKYNDLLDETIHGLVKDKKSSVQVKEISNHWIEGDGYNYTSPQRDMVNDFINSFIQKGVVPIIGYDLELHNHRVESLMSQSKGLDEEGIRSNAYQFLRILDYKPHFMIQEDPNNDEWKPARIKSFIPTQKAATISKVWTETLKQVLLDNKIDTRFAAGFTFNRETQAMRYSDGSGITTYLINPLKVPPTGIQNKVGFMNYMRTTAVHEVAHHFCRYHDEDFVIKYHELESRTWDSWKLYARIGLLR